MAQARGGLAWLVASGFGSGLAPVAPGTAGSLVALGGAALLLQGPGWALPAAVVLSLLGGLWAIPRAGVAGDPGWVVIDEFAGQWMALLPLLAAPGPSLGGMAAGFALFRLFDIAKPGPIGWADRLPGAFGVMADDVLAGLAAAFVLVALRLQWPAWF